MLMVQTELGRGTRRMVALLPQDKRVRVGTVISLHKDGLRWKVLEQFGSIDLSAVNRGWNNNI
jgi:hypothetical protein